MDRKKETNSQKRNQLNAETASTQNFIAPNANCRRRCHHRQ